MTIGLFLPIIQNCIDADDLLCNAYSFPPIQVHKLTGAQEGVPSDSVCLLSRPSTLPLATIHFLFCLLLSSSDNFLKQFNNLESVETFTLYTVYTFDCQIILIIIYWVIVQSWLFYDFF